MKHLALFVCTLGLLALHAGEKNQSNENNPSETEVMLPEPIDDVQSGGGGRYLILHLKKLRKLAIFDATTRKITYLSVPENILYAVGRDKLVVAITDSNRLQRYNLHTLEQEASAPSPVDGLMVSMTMGSDSHGPLLMQVCNDINTGNCGLYFVEIEQMSSRALPIEEARKLSSFYQRTPSWTSHFYFQRAELRQAYGDVNMNIQFRASADGTIFALFMPFYGPAIGVLDTSAKEIRSYYLEGKSRNDIYTNVAPSADGALIFSGQGIFTSKLEPVKLRMYKKVFFLPSNEPCYFFGYQPVINYISMIVPEPNMPIFVFNGAENPPLISLPRFNVGTRSSSCALSADKIYHFLPRFNLIVSIPFDSSDRLILRHFDILEAVKAAGVDYLFVSSSPPTIALKLKPYVYQVIVQSKNGGVKFGLDSAPAGMTLSESGELKWIPGDNDVGASKVVIRVSDKSNQEFVHSFSIKVR